jgi:hypothetical protein
MREALQTWTAPFFHSGGWRQHRTAPLSRGQIGT